MAAVQQILAAFGVAATIPQGQTVFTSSGTWTVPAGVTSIAVVAVQSGSSATPTTVTYNSTIVCRALNGSRIGDGGGDGGAGGPGVYYGGPGGGAGGYTGNGGAGGYDGNTGQSGSGGGGGGGGGGGVSESAQIGGGGGVGLLGQGASGGATGYVGGGGSGGTSGGFGFGGNYGGGAPGAFSTPGSQGGALAYKNNIAVTPGTTVTVSTSGNGAVRIIWGAGRAFPSTSTGDV